MSLTRIGSFVIKTSYNTEISAYDYFAYMVCMLV